jgi:hypothetical protein
MDHGPGAGDSDVPVDLSKTKVLGRYHLGEPLGVGRPARSFRSKVYGVAGYERQYAVKRVPHGAGRRFRWPPSGWRRRRAHYATVTHPHIARLAELRVAGNPGVRRRRAGQRRRTSCASSRRRRRFGDPVPRGALLAMLVQVARAVAYAHGRGVVHGGALPDQRRPSRATATPRSPTSASCAPACAVFRRRTRRWWRGCRTSPPSSSTARGDPRDRRVRAGERGDRGADRGSAPFAGKHPQELAAARCGAGVLEKPTSRRPCGRCSRRRSRRRWAASPVRARSPTAFESAGEEAVVCREGRADLRSAVKRVHARSADLAANSLRGLMSFPLPAPPVSTRASRSPACFPTAWCRSTRSGRRCTPWWFLGVEGGGSTPPPDATGDGPAM